MKELEEVAKTFTSLAQLYMVSGNWRPVYKTGDLYKNIGSYNKPSRMITSKQARSKTKLKIPEPSFNVSLQYAPDIPGPKTGKPTTYGKFVEEGFTTRAGTRKDGKAYKRTKVQARPFAQKASQDPLLKKKIDAYIGGYMEKDFLPIIKIGLDRAFRSLSAERAKAR
jgi:hypothetical protein